MSLWQSIALALGVIVLLLGWALYHVTLEENDREDGFRDHSDFDGDQ